MESFFFLLIFKNGLTRDKTTHIISTFNVVYGHNAENFRTNTKISDTKWVKKTSRSMYMQHSNSVSTILFTIKLTMVNTFIVTTYLAIFITKRRSDYIDMAIH